MKKNRKFPKKEHVGVDANMFFEDNMCLEDVTLSNILSYFALHSLHCSLLG